MHTTAQISLDDGIIVAEKVAISITKSPHGERIDISGIFWLPYGAKDLEIKSTVNARLADGETWKLQIREPGDASRGFGYLFNARPL